MSVALSVSACSSGPERSVEAFCTTMNDHKQAYLDQMTAAQGQGLSGLLTAASALGDLKLMWSDLADVAPEDIRQDTEAVRDAWAKQEDDAASRNWSASLVTGVLNAGSMGRVDTYVRSNCDGSFEVPVAASDDTSDTDTPAPTPTPVTTAVAVTVDGLVTGGSAVIDSKSGTLYSTAAAMPVTVSAYVTPGQHAESVTWGLEAFADDPVLVAGVAVIVTEQSGLTPQSKQLVLQTFDPKDGHLLTNVAVDPSITGQLMAQMPDRTSADDAVQVEDVKVSHGTVVVAFVGNDHGRRPSLIGAFDPRSGALLWSTPVAPQVGGCSDGTLHSDVGVGGGGDFDTSAPVTAQGLYVYANSSTVFAVDTKTGAPAWHASVHASCNTWLDVNRNPVSDAYVLASGNGAPSTVLDARTGALVTADVESFALDPVTGDLAISYQEAAYGSTHVADGHPSFEVVNPSGTVFTLPADQGIPLGTLAVVAAFDGRVWISTTNGADVITASDGAPDSAAEQYVGTHVLASTKSWTLVGDDDSGVLIWHPGSKAPTLEVLGAVS